MNFHLLSGLNNHMGSIRRNVAREHSCMRGKIRQRFLCELSHRRHTSRSGLGSYSSTTRPNSRWPEPSELSEDQVLLKVLSFDSVLASYLLYASGEYIYQGLYATSKLIHRL